MFITLILLICQSGNPQKFLIILTYIIRDSDHQKTVSENYRNALLDKIYRSFTTLQIKGGIKEQAKLKLFKYHRIMCTHDSEESKMHKTI